jgi:hypothetical protein
MASPPRLLPSRFLLGSARSHLGVSAVLSRTPCHSDIGCAPAFRAVPVAETTNMLAVQQLLLGLVEFVGR